jgi:hypothetical protein
MRKSFAIAVMVLFACAGSAAAKKMPPEIVAAADELGKRAEPEIAQPGKFRIVSERDPKATNVRLVPLGVAGGFSCNIGIMQLGDSQFAKDRLARLERALLDAFPNEQPSDLIIRRYDLYANHGQEVWSATLSMGIGGAIGGAIAASQGPQDGPEIKRKPKCEAENMKGGWFDKADLTSNAAPFVIDLDVTVFGKPYKINAARSPELDLTYPGRDELQHSPATAAMLQWTMTKAHERLVAAIRADHPLAPEPIPPMDSATPETGKPATDNP